MRYGMRPLSSGTLGFRGVDGGLRLTEPLPWRRLYRVQGSDAAPFDADVVADLEREGYIHLTDHGVLATAAGRQRLNAVVGALLAARSSDAAPESAGDGVQFD